MDLPGLDEPVGLRARAATDPDAVRGEIEAGRFLIGPLWKAWGPVLAPAGVGRTALSTILRGYAYELWLWAAGERTWAQCLEGLAARVSRRAAGQRKPRPARARKKAVGPARSRTATRRPASKPTTARSATKTTKTTKTTKARAPRPSRASKTAKASKTSKASKIAKTTQVGKTSKARKSTKSTKSTKVRRPTRSARRTGRR